MTKRHGKLNVKLNKMVSNLWDILDEYKTLAAEYEQFMEEKESEFEEAGEDPYDDDDFECAMEDRDQFVDCVYELGNLLGLLDDLSSEIMEPSLGYAEQ